METISVQSAKQNLGIAPAPHVFSPMSTTKLMLIVLGAMVPAIGVLIYFMGFAIVYQLIISSVTAIFCQVLTAFLRGRSIKNALKDVSGLVTAFILAISLPALMPWYFTVAAVAFAMLIVRECFGGLGMNIFNPAMAGFVFLMISVPGIFYSTWISPTPNAIFMATPERTFEIVFKGASPTDLVKEINHNAKAQQQVYYAKSDNDLFERYLNNRETTIAELQKNQDIADTNAGHDALSYVKNHDEGYAKLAEHDEIRATLANPNDPLSIYISRQALERTKIDGLSGATYLDSIKTSRKASLNEASADVDFLSPHFIGYVFLAGAYTLGGLILIFTGVIRFQMPLAFLLTVGILSAIWHHYDPAMSINAYEQLITGSTIFVAFFILTDPVTTCGTFKGRIYFSIICGCIFLLIRVYGSYADAGAFAIMLSNCIAPLMDVMTKRRPFGIGYRKGGLD